MEAEQALSLAAEFGALPFAGALLDQPVILLRWRGLVAESLRAAEPDPLSTFAMEIG